MNKLSQLKQALETGFPDVECLLDLAESETGASWLNLAAHDIAIEYRPARGFGLFLSAETGYGGRPDELYTDVTLLQRRLEQLLAGRLTRALSVREGGNALRKRNGGASNVKLLGRVSQQAGGQQITLKQIRDVLGLTQAVVAQALGKQQSAISKIEKRDDVLLSTLVSLIHCMHGSLEIKALFDGFEVCIYSDREIKQTTGAP